MGFPPTGNNGLGTSEVKGANRLPNPPANTIACVARKNSIFIYFALLNFRPNFYGGGDMQRGEEHT
jgi:hypothetical protein